MKYSRKEIDRAGFALIGDADPFKRQQASALVEDWRKSHWTPLRELNDELTDLFMRVGVVFNFSSHRIKRMQSIVEKIKNNQEGKMGLGGLQDIGGIRFVFPDINTLLAADKVVSEYIPKNFILKKKNDYIFSGPKDSGYRCIHLVYKYQSEDKEFDGLQIELQIRTQLQHYWAMAVETASLISRTSLKAAIEDGSVWRGFFKLISCIFAKKEGTPIHQGYLGYSDWEFCEDYAIYLEEHKLLDQLRALQVTVNHDVNKEIEEGYCVLVVDFNRKIVHFQHFETEDEAQASDIFTDMEKHSTEDEAVLMVSMEKMSELRDAYPSYFLDAKNFLSALQEFDQSCAMMFNDKMRKL